jgi:DNA-binding CsgD family transcriptional regulator
MATDTGEFASARRNEAELNERQRTVLDLLVAGKTNAEIGDALGMSLDGAKWNVSEILTKLGLDSRERAAEYWRWRNRPAAKAGALRGIASLGSLKWIAATAVVAAAAIGLLALFSRPAEKAEGELPAFYLEARLESYYPADSIATNVSGVEFPPERRVTLVRWWNRDFDHLRIEVETLEPADEAGTDIIVVDRSEQTYFRDATNTYSRTPSYVFPEGSKPRVRPWSMASFIGPWMSPVASIDKVMEQLRTSSDNNVTRTVQIVGHERLLGMPATIVELSPATSSTNTDGVVTSSGSIRYWIDEERMVVLRQVADLGGNGEYSIEVTNLEWDAKVEDEQIRFDPPSGAQQDPRKSLSVLVDSVSGGTRSSSTGPPFNVSFNTPAGMLRLDPMPAGFRAEAYDEERDAADRITLLRVAYSDDDSRAFVLEQRFRPGGLRASVVDTGVPTTIRGFPAYWSPLSGEVVLTWAEGDLVVRISAVGMEEATVLAIAAGLIRMP